MKWEKDIVEYLKPTLKSNAPISIESFPLYKSNPDATIKQFQNLHRRNWIIYNDNDKTAILDPGGESEIEKLKKGRTSNVLSIIALIIATGSFIIALLQYMGNSRNAEGNKQYTKCNK